MAAVTNSMIEPFLMGYLLAINILAFCVMGFDKQKARKGVWRISESTLFTLAIFGRKHGRVTWYVDFQAQNQTPQIRYWNAFYSYNSAGYNLYYLFIFYQLIHYDN